MRTRRLLMTGASIGLSVAVTSACSYAFHGTVGLDFLTTGVVAAAVTDAVVDRLTSRLREANRKLAREAASREAELQAARAAAGVAHEVKNPLGAVIGNLELAEELLDEVPGDADELRRTIRSAQLAAKHMLSIVADLSPLARPTDEEPARPVDLAVVAATALRIAQPRLQPVGRAEVALDGVPAVLGNESRLVQVLLNLVINAALASRDGVENVIRLSGQEDGGFVHLRIEDRGTGMTREVLARVFEPGFTTRAGRGGTGLGLPIVRSIVEGSGGRVEVQSTPGEGTTFHLWLPVAVRTAASVA